MIRMMMAVFVAVACVGCGAGALARSSALPRSLSYTSTTEPDYISEVREACSAVVPYRIVTTQSGMRVRCFAHAAD